MNYFTADWDIIKIRKVYPKAEILETPRGFQLHLNDLSEQIYYIYKAR